MANVVIRKDHAILVAQSMAESYKLAEDKAMKELGAYIADAYDRKVPQDVKIFQKKYPGYISVFKYEYMKFTGEQYSTNIDFNRSVITMFNAKGLDFRPPFTKAERGAMDVLWDVYKKSKIARIEAERTFKCTLLGLRTFKRIAAEFPEAAPFLKDELAEIKPVTPQCLAKAKKLIISKKKN